MASDPRTIALERYLDRLATIHRRIEQELAESVQALEWARTEAELLTQLGPEETRALVEVGLVSTDDSLLNHRLAVRKRGQQLGAIEALIELAQTEHQRRIGGPT